MILKLITILNRYKAYCEPYMRPVLRFREKNDAGQITRHHHI